MTPATAAAPVLVSAPPEPSTAAGPISVVVVAYNSGECLLDCVASVLREPAVGEVIVVNNGAGGREIAIAERLGRVEVVHAPRNLGFAAGCNLGAAHADGAVLAFLNPDTVVAPGALSELARTLEDPSVAIVTPRLRLLRRPELLNSSGNVVHFTGLGWAGGYGQSATPVVEERDVACPSGAAMAMRADTFRELGGFREELFLYHEDLELGWRAHMRGRRVVMNPRADVYHDYEFDRHACKRYFLERNRVAFLLLSFSVRTLLLVAPVLVALELSMLALALRQGWARDKLAGWAWCARNLPTLLRRRRETQRQRLLRDRELVPFLAAAIDPSVVRLPGIVRAMNPLLGAYWSVARRAV